MKWDQCEIPLHSEFQVEKVSPGLYKNKDIGKLLYHVATKLKNKKYQSLVVDYIARQKITLEAQLDGRYIGLY